MFLKKKNDLHCPITGLLYILFLICYIYQFHAFSFDQLLSQYDIDLLYSYIVYYIYENYFLYTIYIFKSKNNFSLLLYIYTLITEKSEIIFNFMHAMQQNVIVNL